MEFDDLKSNWQQSGGSSKSQKELEMMTKVKNHPQLKRIKLKLISETVLLIGFLTMYYNAFDGDQKPVWLNILLGISVILYIANDAMGFYTLQNPIKGTSISNSINKLLGDLQKLLVYSLATSFFFGIVMMLFFSTTVSFDNHKYFILFGIAATFFVMMFISYKSWSGRINQIKESISEFNND
ncbi:hypothetical protein [Chondrinema litorale]|uniref:hypothetical protein n=1 Tax=Chondrinema litorale TaxID=2994555 RepID=UPI0025433E0D|nr:hypothetical protein [Chondrinema litorale]UZR97966.1 hypothetical protein OQ292_28495 [Chondrinema litorale]